MTTPTAADAATYLEAQGRHEFAAAIYQLMSDNARLRGENPPTPEPTGQPSAKAQANHRTDDEVVAEVYLKWSTHPQFPFEKPSILDVQKIAAGGCARAARIRDLVRKAHMHRLAALTQGQPKRRIKQRRAS